MKKQQKHRMYENPVLELLSLSGPKMMIGFHLIVATGFLYFGNQFTKDIALLSKIGFFVFGMLFWSFTEYIMHRYVFHLEGNTKLGKAFHYAMHGYHHDHPTDYNRLFMPPVPVSIFIALFFGLFYLFMGQNAWFFMPGFEIGYLLYSLIHYAVHTKKNPPFLDALGLHHDLHHFRFEDKAFGVSSRLWDRIFGTMPEIRRKALKKSE